MSFSDKGGGCAVGRRTFGQTRGDRTSVLALPLHLLPFRNLVLGNFVYPTLPVSFGRDIKSRLYINHSCPDLALA